jgi:hypothetical protein
MAGCTSALPLPFSRGVARRGIVPKLLWVFPQVLNNQTHPAQCLKDGRDRPYPFVLQGLLAVGVAEIAKVEDHPWEVSLWVK